MSGLRLLILGACLLVLPGCATGYEPKGFAGGYSDSQWAPDAFRVTFNGNGHTSKERAQDFVLLRAADLTLDHGFTHFMIVDGEHATKVDAIQLEGESTTSGKATVSQGQISYSERTTYTPGPTMFIRKPKTTVFIQCLQDPSEGAFDAAFLAKSLRETYGIKPRPAQTPSSGAGDVAARTNAKPPD